MASYLGRSLRLARGPRLFANMSCAPFYSRMMSTTPEIIRYEFLDYDEVEIPRFYRPGGYCPMKIGDQLHSRYRVVHKLGFSPFSSTVWLGLDKGGQYVAIKVHAADMRTAESDILAKVRAGTNANMKSMISNYIDHFQVSSPNGTHDCVVTTLARCSLRDAKEGCLREMFPLDVARSLAAQLVAVIASIHSQGFTHGDLNMGNVLLQLPYSLNGLTVEQLYERFGAPDPQAIIREDGKPNDVGVPSHAIPSIWLGPRGEDLLLHEARLVLADFGSAFRPSDQSQYWSNTLLKMQPPEELLTPTTPLSFPADIWSLGCLIFELFAGMSLVDGWCTRPGDVLAEYVELQGKMPREWWDKWEDRARWCNEDGTRRSQRDGIWTWDRRFRERVSATRISLGMVSMDFEEKLALLDLLRWMLAWKPEERPTAAQVLQSEWMVDWVNQRGKGWVMVPNPNLHPELNYQGQGLSEKRVKHSFFSYHR